MSGSNTLINYKLTHPTVLIFLTGKFHKYTFIQLPEQPLTHFTGITQTRQEKLIDKLFGLKPLKPTQNTLRPLLSIPDNPIGQEVRAGAAENLCLPAC